MGVTGSTSSALVGELVACLGSYLGFLLPAVAALLAVHVWGHVPREVFRKLLHMVAFFSAPVIMHAAARWQVAVLVLVLFGAVVWPILVLAERIPQYADLFVERHTHEVRRSLLILFWGNAAVVAMCWGLCGRPLTAVASILMWGFGDAAAALVGKRFGRHHVRLPLADQKKTWEGSGAMLAVATLVGLVVLGLRPQVLFAALLGAYVELVTHRGYDTITVPVSVAAVLLLLG